MKTRTLKYALVTAAFVSILLGGAYGMFFHPDVTFVVLTSQEESGESLLHCEINNHSEWPVELWFHSSNGQPCFQRLQLVRGSWLPMVEFACCGIDLEARIVSPGEIISFKARRIDSASPTRLEIHYRQGHHERRARTRPIFL